MPRNGLVSISRTQNDSPIISANKLPGIQWGLIFSGTVLFALLIVWLSGMLLISFKRTVEEIDRLNARLQPLTSFILPGGSPASAWCHHARTVCRRAERLGGVLITKIPAGMECKPHVDGGWHAGHYEKYGIQIASAPGQRFCFEGESLETRPGDVFWFDNSHTHWVTNDTEHDRITLIVTLKRGG